MIAVKVLFWVSLGGLAWTHVGYPAFAVIAARLFPRTVRRSDATPSVAVIVAAHDEEAVIGRRIENLRALDYPSELSSSSSPRTRRAMAPRRSPKPPARG